MKKYIVVRCSSLDDLEQEVNWFIKQRNGVCLGGVVADSGGNLLQAMLVDPEKDY